MKSPFSIRNVFPCVCIFTLLFLVTSMGLYLWFKEDEDDNDCKSQLKNITNVVEYRGFQVYSSSLTDSLKVQIDSVVDCGSLFKGQQPTIVVGADTSSYYDRGCNIIHMNSNHSSLLVHEYVHYLDLTLYQNNLTCARTLFSQMVHGPGTQWGDGQGYPYCYNKNPLPNQKEYLSVMAEGYCTNECGPTRSYFDNASNPISSLQLQCLQNFV